MHRNTTTLQSNTMRP